MNNMNNSDLDEMSAPQMFTSLPDGTRVRKDDLRIEACGAVDELNSQIGLLVTDAPEELKSDLYSIQRSLFAVGAHLVGVEHVQDFPGTEAIQCLQERILFFQKKSDKFRGFILPGGSRVAAQSHICRTVCRRAERSAVRLNSYPDVLYLNKLSGYFFFLSIYLNKIMNIDEIKV